jgi:hypothetical protein
MVDTSVECPVNESTSVVCWFKKELCQLIKLLCICTDNRKSGMNHCSFAMASANLMEVTL